MAKWMQDVYNNPFGANIQPSIYMMNGENCRVTIHHTDGSFDAVAWDVNRITNRFKSKHFDNLADAKAWGEDMDARGGW